MYKSKLIRYLSAFTVEEAQQLGFFIESPLFNSGKRPFKVQQLLQHLLLFHPQYISAELKKKSVYQAVFPEEDFNMGKLSKLASESVKVVQHFIRVCCQPSRTDFDDWLIQLQFFQQRGLNIDFYYALDQAQKLLEGTTQKDQENFFQQFIIETERIKHQIKFNDKKGNANLPNTIRNLDLFYIVSKMEFCSYLLTRSNSAKINTQPSMILLEPVLKAAKELYMDVPVVSAYYHTYSLLLRSEQSGEEEFQLLKEDIEQNADLIPIGALKTIHTCMRNYLANRYIEGDSKCLADLFELFKEQIQWGTIYQDGFHILASTLQNAITVALKLKETEWAMCFLKEHENRIKGADDGKAMYQFNMANILFHQGKYQEAQDCLEHYHFREMFYNLAVRRLGIKLDYETKLPLDVFEFRLKALKSFVYEQKKLLPPDKFDSNNNFVKLMMQLFTFLKEDSELFFQKNEQKDRRSHLQKLIEKVENEKTIAEREWLLEILQSLLSSYQFS